MTERRVPGTEQSKAAGGPEGDCLEEPCLLLRVLHGGGPG
jgi:hypothetical protein